MLNRNNSEYWLRFWNSFMYGLDFEPFSALMYVYNTTERRDSIYKKYRHIYGGNLHD